MKFRWVQHHRRSRPRCGDRHCQGVAVAAVSRRCSGGPADRGPQPRYVNAALDSSHRQPSAEDTALDGIVRR